MIAPKLYTSYFGNVARINRCLDKLGKYEFVGICFVPISRFTPPGFGNKHFFKEVEPSNSLLQLAKSKAITSREYDEVYREQLKYVNFHDIETKILNLGPTDIMIFLCYEKPEDHCHRHLFAEYLSRNGLSCKEFPNDEESILSLIKNVKFNK